MPSRAPTAVPAATGKIIGFALIAGVVMFAAASFLRRDEPSSPQMKEWAPVILGIAGVVTISLVALLPRKMSARVRKRKEEAREEIRAGRIPFEIYQAQIQALAFAEGWGLLGAAFHWLTAEPMTLIAPAIAIPLMLMNIPTPDRARRLLE